MRVGIFGAGGIGAYFGGRLAAAGVDVALIARGAHLEAIRARGLTIESVAGDERVDDVFATDDPGAAGVVELLLMTTKTWQLPEAAEAARPMVGPGTLVIGLQNGVEAAEVMGEALGPERVVNGLCRIISYVSAPGVVRHVGADPTIVFGERDGRTSDRCRRAAEVLERARGVSARVSNRIVEELWSKFFLMASLGAVGAVTRAPFGVCRGVGPLRAMLVEAMKEVVEVGRAHGVRIGEDAIDEALRFVDGLPEAGTSSIQRDTVEGRRSELDALSGAVVRLGAAVGVPTPVHGTLYAALLPTELKARGAVSW
jgi:2-dehydropantoate 2-reductase